MKLFQIRWVAAFCALLVSVGSSFGLVIDTDTVITPYDTNYESLDLVVTNCTLTVDGTHTFNNLQLLSGGVLTHSSSGDGGITNIVTVTNEPYLLSDTNPILVAYTNFLTNTIFITDLTGVTNYANGLDYGVSNALIVRLPGSAILDGQVLLVSYQAVAMTSAGLFLTISNNFEVEVGGKVDLAGKGFASGQGTAAGTVVSGVGSGGGHGGYGGVGSGVQGGSSYGSADQPATLGSGGSLYGGNGGGIAQIQVGNLARIDGIISVNGTKAIISQMGGGAGGSIWLTAPTLVGTGSISANGGTGELYLGGGGGGGRIAIYANTNLFTGDVVARGGAGWGYGGAGTIYLKGDATSVAQVIVDNRGASGTNTAVSAAGSYDLTIQGKASVAGSLTGIRNLTIRSNSWLVPAGLTQTVNLGITGDALIEANSGLMFDLKGYRGGSGSGTPFLSSLGQGGGGNGGQGGSGLGGYFGNVTGIFTSPTSFGSGGGGGSTGGGVGGGAVTMTVSGKLSLFGQITANGGNALDSAAGGGAGGSIYLSVGTLTGNGKITANGGNGDLPAGGGGGGGRIAIYYGTNTFTGPVTTFGGYGFVFGGAGTIFTKVSVGQNGLLLADNGGAYGAGTPVSFGTPYDVVIVGGAVMSNNVSTPYMNSLYVGSNSYYIPSGFSIVVNQNVTVENTGAISADGTGYSNTGVGLGKQGSAYGSGGGYGGIGGSTNSGAILGGSTYGSVTSPVDAGSSGGIGSGTSPYSYGGSGGGIVRMTVNGTLTVNGSITANGAAGLGGNSGGGSGGSINLTVGRIQGAGVISANGGVGESLQGGGGGGGRIAINYFTNNFAGTTMAQGGAGKSYGGAGTVFRKAISSSYGQLIIDNGGNSGAATPFGLVDCDLTLSGGAILTNNTTFTASLRSLFIGSNSVFQAPVGTCTLTVATNMTIAAGGKFSADGMGTTSQQGAGGSSASTGGGGAFGGNGGASSLGAAGGLAFTATSGAMGGTGGYSTTPGTGGFGGGGVTLTVNGNLQVDGKLSANGMSAVVSGAGGGAGGALTLTLGRLMGSGIISANGGAGEAPAGGGGGGGRLNITYNTNTFTGQITAFGGAGANYGGAGPVSLKLNTSQTTQWIVDNGGFSGAVTPFAPTGELLIKGSAIVTNISSGQTCNSLYIATNSWLIPNFNSGSVLTVSSNLVIEEGGGITADGWGYANGAGQGAGGSISSVGAGGGHGGNGGPAVTGSLGGVAYDSITVPTSFGSSGGSGSNAPLNAIYGGAGGGYINLNVIGALTNNGKITANGTVGKGTGSGGGAGGSVLLIVGTLAGKGSISVNGGAGENAQAGGGGGGRIAITYGTNNLTGAVTAYGGAGWVNGGAGTIYWKLKNSPNPNIQLVIDNGGLSGAGTPWNNTMDSQASITVRNGSTWNCPSGAAIGSLVIKSNGVVTSVQTNAATVSLDISGDVTIEAGGRLHVDGVGYNTVGSNGGGSSIGVSTPYGPTGGGGGHGGYGGNSVAGAAGGIYQGSATTPVTFGGAGGAGNSGPFGGGAVRMTISGNLRVDGVLSANGQSGTSSGNGGGAGGSVYITMNQGTLRGSGVIQANGGAGDLPGGGGGGGGRIALYFRTNLFAGNITTFGGAGANYGGAGTIYLSTNNQLSELIIDNGGNRGALTPILVNTRVSILGGAVGTVTTSSTFDSLVIGSNAWLSYSNSFPTITVTKNTVIKKGGGVLLAGKGAPNGVGSGPSNSSGSGGGGHGGYGGPGAGGLGGTYHDSIFGPINNGGSGGTTTGLPALGGGAFRFVTAQTLQLDGDINVNGVNATNAAAGGGAGGSVWISAGTFTGSGSIQANGGAGKFTGGGGAGGMVALFYNINSFSGSTSAHGGSGFVAGAAGTIYTRTNFTTGTLIVDNAGIAGTNTPIVSTQTAPFNLVVQGRANVTQTNRQVFASLIVAPDGAIVHSPTTTNLDLVVLQDAVVNGVITADRNGLTNGPGSGEFAFAGGGGGYGGNGGDSSFAAGGTNYGSLEFPTSRGSGGGLGDSYPLGPMPQPGQPATVGGGAIRLQVAGALTVNGNISSSGGDGLINNTGGGSGGSIWVTASSFDGIGSISANGGNGEPSDAGGGGGGRIAVYAHTNVFTGLYSVNGGQGWMNGATGTVFLGTNFFGPRIVSMSVTGTVTTAVSGLDLQFDSVLDATTSQTDGFALETPSGILLPSGVFYGPSPSTIHLSFPAQTAVGNYSLHVKPYIYDIFEVPMSTSYSNGFAIAPLLISGTVMDTNNAPLSGIQLLATGLSPVTSDTNGAYTVAVNPTWTGTITPDTNYTFLPASRSYTNVVANTTNQNFVIVTPDVMKLSATSTPTDLTFGIFGVSQVNYQAYSSSNLVDWIPYGPVITGGNSNISLTLPITSSNQFFQFRISN